MGGKKDITYEYDREFGDIILEDTKDGSINLRKVSWNGAPYKVDIRRYKYDEGTEITLKGIGITDQGADELAKALVEKGFGKTKDLVNAIKKRKDFNDPEIASKLDQFEDDPSEEGYYDPKELLA